MTPSFEQLVLSAGSQASARFLAEWNEAMPAIALGR